MNATLKAELAKLTLVEKLALVDEIEAEIAALGCPPGVMSEEDPKLEAELERRWQELRQNPEGGINLEELDARISRRLTRGA